MAAPIPDLAALTVAAISGLGAGPHTIADGVTFASPVEGTPIDLGPYLTTRLKYQDVGSDQIAFTMSLQPDMDSATWDSLTPYNWWWARKAERNPLVFVYRKNVAAKSTANPEFTIHITKLPNSPPIPGESDTVATHEIAILAAYLKIDFSATTHEWGTVIT